MSMTCHVDLMVHIEHLSVPIGNTSCQSPFTSIRSFIPTMHFSTSPLLISILLAWPTSHVSALPAGQNDARADNARSSYVIAGVGTFTQSATYTFTGTTLPSGLYASDQELIRDQANGALYNHIFQASNVVVKDGYLQIKVPGGQTPASAPNSAITAGEVFTGEQNILYGSVRTRLVFSAEPGTCQGSFFYKSDTQETDIEFLSDPASKANTGGKAQLHYTNQPTNGGSSTTAAMAAPADVGTAEHEYRIDWTSGYTAFYIDGALQKKHTQNVPSVAGTWLWNNWVNGDIQWSYGPPKKDSVMKIKSIVMYYNTTTTA